MKKISTITGVCVVLLGLVARVGYPMSQRQTARDLFAEALKYQQDRNWTQMEQSLRKAIELRPDYLDAWECLAWNYCYNVSEDFDQVEDKYRTIKRGIEIAIEGSAKNPKSARLQWDVGWDFFHKVGKSLESEQYRRLFAQDSQLHDLLRGHIDADTAVGPHGKPDSFLVAKLWFAKSSLTADRCGLDFDKERMPAGAFYSYPAHSQAQFAMAIEEDGVTEETARRAWQEAEHVWQDYGNRELSYGGHRIRLNDRSTLVALKNQLSQAKSPEQGETTAGSKKAQEIEEKLYWVNRVRAMINFDYWLERCRAEQTDRWLAARRLLFKARQQATEAKSDSKIKENARTLFEQAFDAWAQIRKDKASLVEDELISEELVRNIRMYRAMILDGNGLPEKFPLRDLADRWEKREAETRGGRDELERRPNR